MRNRFVTASEPVRLQLVDVTMRAHQALIDRKQPEPTLDELNASQARLDAAIEDAAWIDIKPALSAGENRAMQTRFFEQTNQLPQPGQPIVPRVNFQRVGFTKVAAYLLGWNLEDERGPVTVPLGDDEDATAARERLLEHLDAQTFDDIVSAIDFYESERTRRRDGNPTHGRSSEAISG